MSDGIGRPRDPNVMTPEYALHHLKMWAQVVEESIASRDAWVQIARDAGADEVTVQQAAGVL